MAQIDGSGGVGVNPASSALGRRKAHESKRACVADLAALLLVIAVSVGVSTEDVRDSVAPHRSSWGPRAVTIDVNSAPWFEWTLLEGIGDVRAERIVAHRREHGPFHDLSDLKAIAGMPVGWYVRSSRFLRFDVPAGTSVSPPR